MNVIFLSPHFPPNYYLFCRALHRLGTRVLAIGEEPYENLRPELREALAEYYRVGDMEDYEQVLRVVGYFVHRHGRIDRVDSHNEHWLETEARLRTDFNVSGPRLDELPAMKYKSLMKQKLQAAGVSVARGIPVGNREEGQRFLAEVGYPVVVKPDKGVGATATYLLENDADLEGFFAQKPPVDYFMEEFVHGTIHTFDGLVDRDGTVVFCTSHVMSDGIMEVVNGDRHVAYYSLRVIPEELRQLGFIIIQAYGLRERFFHFEFFLENHSRRWLALEVNIRPPGGFTMDMFNYACDIDLYQQWANVLVHNRFTADYTRRYHCCYIGRKAHIPYAHTHEEVLHRVGPLLLQAMTMPPLFSRAMGHTAYLIRSPHLEEIREAIAYIHATR